MSLAPDEKMKWDLVFGQNRHQLLTCFCKSGITEQQLRKKYSIGIGTFYHRGDWEFKLKKYILKGSYYKTKSGI
jgi:hypothetical protein